MGVGRAKKSMGNVTYRVVRGRTIGSQKRGKAPAGAATRGVGGNFRKPLFAMINMYARAHATDIQVSFNKSRYGSQRNYFFTVNYSALQAALLQLATTAAATKVLPELSAVEAAITAYATANPASIFRVKLAKFDTVYLTGAWSSNDNPISGGGQDGLGTGTVTTNAGASASFSAPIALSSAFHAGAKIVRDAGSVTILANAIPSGVTEDTVVFLSASGTAVTGIDITEVTSSPGSLEYKTGALTESMNIAAVQINGSIYVRLTSAYTKEEVEDPTA